MLSKEQFVRRILDGARATSKKASKTASSPAAFSADDVFGSDDTTPASSQPPADTRFAQLLLEEVLEKVFGHGEAQDRDEIVLGDQRTTRLVPHRGRYWPKTNERPFHTVLFELDKKGRELLADGFFNRNDLLEDALHRIIQDVLDGFEKRRAASARQGAQTETLCVVSIVDDRNSSTGRQLVCFGTKSTETKALEIFTLREEVRDWDRPLAEEHLEQLFSRHFEKLASGAKWQDAFITGAERKKISDLLAACTQRNLLGIAEEELRKKLRDVLDEIAGSFGINKKAAIGNRRLDMVELPVNHGIGADPEESQHPGFKNPLQGVRIYDRDNRLLGFVVYVASTKAQVEPLREALATNNHFHNVLVIYPDSAEPELELWQGGTPLRGRLTRSARRTVFDGEGGVVQLLSRFFVVSRSAIEKPKQLATELAWRAQHLKALALEELEKEIASGNDKGPLKKLFDTFNAALATLTVEKFADAYAQTITYGMLAARWISSGESPLFTRKNLKDLLPETSAFLKDLFDKLVNSNFDKNLSWLLDDITSLLARTSVAQVFQDEKRDPSIHFYEDFLDAYDPQVRKDQGVYYTPDEVVSYIVRTAHASLQNDFGLPLGLADTTTWAAFAKTKKIAVPEGVDPKAPFVQVLDPALGTGTFILRVIEVIHDTMLAEFKRQGLDEDAARKAWITYVRKDLLPRINGFELMMAPYIVSHLRLGLALQETGFTFTKNDRLRVFLTNTLEMHTPSQLSFIGEHVAEEAKEADRVKREAAISVVVGNPPYEREPAEIAGNHKGGWVRSGWNGWRGGRALLEDFAEPTRNAGRGGDLKNIYNLYVYFWRWAMWRVFDRHKAPGIVSFITASSYLRGPGFSGMREEMRRAAERVFIFDLEGDQRGTRITDNVFCITIPVCVGSMVLATTPDRTAPAVSSYKRITGTREDKLKAADVPRKFGDVAWSPAPSGWLDVLMAGGSATTSASYDTWPAATDVFPWQHSGAQFKRTWPIECDVDVLERRWEALLAASPTKRGELFRESRDRKVSATYPALEANGDRLPSLHSLSKAASAPKVRRFGFRSFDRQHCFADTRVGDYVRPVLWNVDSDRQVFITSLLANLIGAGPAATVSAFVPDLHHFRGSYGGKDVIPLWRDAEAKTANITGSFVTALKTACGKAPSPEDIFAYAYAVLANPGYVKRYEEELQVPGPRLPVTKDKALFERGAALGRELLRWHTYGERFREKGDKFKLAGSAKVVTSIPTTPAKYPEKHKYDHKKQVLRVGDGEVSNVSPEVWNFSVSGLQVVKSWLDYRMKKGAGKKSSPLDDIRPERWTEEMTRELVDLLWVLEHIRAGHVLALHDGDTVTALARVLALDGAGVLHWRRLPMLEAPELSATPELREVTGTEAQQFKLGIDAVLRDVPASTGPIAAPSAPAKTYTPTGSPSNIILYGPPGTGKTHSVRRRALELMGDAKAAAAPLTEVNAEWDRLRREGQIVFCTFHQAFAYEEFVEGLRANTDEKGNVHYRVEPGVFKRLALNAAAEGLARAENATGLDFDTRWSLLVSALEGEPRIATSKAGGEYILETSTRDNVRAFKGVTDAEGVFAALPLTAFAINRGSVKSLAPLAKNETITSFGAMNCHTFADLGPLAKMPALRKVWFNTCAGIKKPNALLRITGLNDVTFWGCRDNEGAITKVCKALVARGVATHSELLDDDD